MRAAPEQPVPETFKRRWLRRLSQLSAMFGAWAPKGLYTRALIIIIAPIVILQTILTFVFLDRHYKAVTGRLAVATAQDIAMLADIYEGNKNKGPAEARRLAKMAEERLHLQVYLIPPTICRCRDRSRSSIPWTSTCRTTSASLSARPFWIDTVGSHGRIQILVKLDGALMRVYAQRAQFLPSNTHFFLVWMVVSATVLLIVAILFLRNQIRPISRWRTRPTGSGADGGEASFKIRGAREVRLAAQAFLEMRRPHRAPFEQRTIMLAGVSHDLRTVLTRFRLQLAMMQAPQVEDLKRDVDEMQLMLEDYMAFAKGNSGERPGEST